MNKGKTHSDPDAIKLYPYREQWAKAYAKEKKIIETELGGRFHEIEHIGSTAVPGMSSALIIDILIGLEDLAELENCEATLNDMGYVRSAFSHGPKHKLYTCDSQQGFHLHFLQSGKLRDSQYVRFREALIADRELAREFKEFKIRLVDNYKCNAAWYAKEKTKWFLAKFKERGM